MSLKYLDENGLLYFWQKIKNKFVAQESGKGLSTNDYTTAEKTKLNGISTGAEVNQNAFSNIAVGTTTVAADTKTDTLTLSAGDNVTLTANSTSDTITIAATDTTYSEATTSTAGLMSTADKTKLNGIEAGATAITVDSTLSSTSTNPLQNKAINTALGNKADLASPTFTGTPKAPTPSASTNNTQIATTAYVTSAISTAISGISGISFEIVTTLPSTGDSGTIYLVSNSGSSTNIYDEYIYVNNAWEKIGTTDVDLSDYVKTTDLVAITNAEIDTIVAS